MSTGSVAPIFVRLVDGELLARHEDDASWRPLSTGEATRRLIMGAFEEWGGGAEIAVTADKTPEGPWAPRIIGARKP